MAGKIITIEGLDGAGKSTQIELLREKLDQLGIQHRYIHFPMLNQGSYGTLIAEFLRGEFGNLEEVHPKLVALLFAEDRNEHKDKLNQWLEEDYVIILDRYVKSNIAFQCAKIEDNTQKEILKKWILDFEFGTNQLPKPEASFFLDVPLQIIENSLKTERNGADRDYLKGQKDIHEASISFQQQVLQEYYKLIDENPSNFHKIACMDSNMNWKSAEVIHDTLFSKIKPLL